MARGRDRDIVLDPHADVLPASRDTLAPRRDIDPRLDREAHAWLEHSPLVADLVVAHVVNVHAEPVAGAVHEEAPVRTVPDEGGHPAFQQTQPYQSARNGQ